MNKQYIQNYLSGCCLSVPHRLLFYELIGSLEYEMHVLQEAQGKQAIQITYDHVYYLN